ncbi:formimidoylglutamate deiminase [Marinivivus vitaminiproducens]|uniref:formimidoylglutamate deiminase n=1 Tax=Marinivivus vitaminiproducens TaxID=3035935 RepID=UPI00279DDA5F|nr:formimidoylglutamate deiminase [Geminicoccaceae bacterium SCSIO 64248]
MDKLVLDEALLPHGWARDVVLSVDAEGWIVAVEEDGDTRGAERVAGIALPGMPNVHSHAHQRAMAGLAERSGPGPDSFWTWRELMYGNLAQLTPDDLETIATHLYVELLKAGYTAVGEFQYLHHDLDGSRYVQPAEMTLRTLEAARAAGIGITCLPVLYGQGDFGEPVSVGQKRFVCDLDGFLDLVDRVDQAVDGDADASSGVAPHSLRAVPPDMLAALIETRPQGPVHIHAAEQEREVDACRSFLGQTPVAWLLAEMPIDERWGLIHCTHMTPREIGELAASGAVAGLCPTTEANLGDGIFAAERYLDAGGRFAIGSDSNSSHCPVEELRWLEYAQRLTTRRRNVLAGAPASSVGRRLFDAATTGGGQALGRRIGALARDHRADLIVLDHRDPLFAGRKGDSVLDTWLFAGNRPVVRHVMVGGRWQIRDGHHADEIPIARSYRSVLERLQA